MHKSPKTIYKIVLQPDHPELCNFFEALIMVRKYKLEKYVYIPETEDCKEIIQVELDKKSDGTEK